MRIDMDNAKGLIKRCIDSAFNRDCDGMVASDHCESHVVAYKGFNIFLYFRENFIPIGSIEVACIQNSEIPVETEPFRTGCSMISVGSQQIRRLGRSASVADAAVIGNSENNGVNVCDFRTRRVQSKPCGGFFCVFILFQHDVLLSGV